MVAMTRMRVIGYLNSRGIFPDLMIMVLKSPEGKVYFSLPTPNIIEVVNWENALKNGNDSIYIAEDENTFIKTCIDEPSKENIFIAFSISRKKEDVKVLSSKDMYEYLKMLDHSAVVCDLDKKVIRVLCQKFWAKD